MERNSLYLKNELTFSSAPDAVDVGGTFCLGVAIGVFIGMLTH